MAEKVADLKVLKSSTLDSWTPPYEESPITLGDISESVLPLSSLFDQVLEARFGDPTWTQGFPTQCWPVFNTAFGGLRPGEITVITGETGTGKTTFALNWAADYARPGKNGVFYISLEMSKTATATKLAQLVHGKPVKELQSDADFYGIKHIFESLNFWFFDHYGPLSLERLRKSIWYAVCEKKTRLIVVDHLGYLIRQDRAETNAIAIGNTMRDLAMIANQLGVTILLIVHPAKLQLYGKRRPVELDDLKGSSDIKQEASNVFSLYQPKRDQPETDLFFLKVRADAFSPSIGGRLRFKFDSRSLWLTEVSKKVEFQSGSE